MVVSQMGKKNGRYVIPPIDFKNLLILLNYSQVPAHPIRKEPNVPGTVFHHAVISSIQ